MGRKLLVLAGSLALLGCANASKDLTGSWRSTHASTDTPFEVGSATFSADGSYSAEMTYGGQTRTDTGQWTLDGKTLQLDGAASRTYKVVVSGDALTMTDPDTGATITMERQ